MFVAFVGMALTVMSQAAFAATASDDFNRADGNLGPDWTSISDGALAISNQQVVGTIPSGLSGDIRTAESYGSDQYSQIEITSTPVSGGDWVGPAVRAQNGGQDTYLGLYWWNGGNPVMELFKRISGNWTQLGNAYSSGPLPAGTQLQLSVTGSDLTFSENGVVRITATDASLTGGAPAIMAYGTPTADNWSGGDQPSAATPEVPNVLMFGAAGIGVLGVSVAITRRRSRRSDTTPAAMRVS